MKRKVSLIVIGLLIVLIPTFIMLSFYLSNRNVPVEIRNTEEIVMKTPDGKTVKASIDGKNKELIQMLCDLTLDAKSVEKLPSDLGDGQLYEVTFGTAGSTLLYRFYFSENPAYCYYTVPSGEAYRMDTAKAESFLNSAYSEPIYIFSKPPAVSVNGSVLPAATLDWEYRLLNGSYRKSGCCISKDSGKCVDLGALAEPLTLDCTPTPDSVLFQAYDDAGALLYEGDGAGLSALKVKEDKTLSICLTLEWKKDAAGASPFAGKATYALTGNLYAPAAFTISHTEVRAGQVFFLSGVHVKNPDSISVEIQPKVGFTPVFVKNGNGGVRALMTLGFSASYLSDSEYTVTVTADNLPEPAVFKVILQGDEYGTFTDYVKKDVLNEVYTLQSRNEFWDQVHEIMAQPSIYRSETGSLTFGEAVKTPDSSRYYHYGTKVIIHEDKSEYRALDTMYCTYGASKPVAVADGKVLYVGETTLTGQMVVIDHGNGIRSWYCNMAEISVHAGDTVKMGDVLGKCLGGGFNGQGGLNMHVALTLENCAIDLQLAIQNGILLG